MMNSRNLLITAAAVFGLCAGGVMAEPSKNFKVFLCFGQSNMSGGSGVNPDADSKKTNPRIKVLAFDNCSSPQRTKNAWSDAAEPMHCGDGVSAMGPSFAFGQALIDSLDAADTIGLIPCGLWGVGIEMFVKGGNYTGSNKPSGFGNNAWDWMLTKCKEGIKRGVFSGIILHQGEANSGQSSWLTQVKKIYDDLKTENIFEGDVPLVAGELLQASGACCAGHNTVIAKIPETLPFGYVASSQGLVGGGSYTQYHFDQAGYRKMGQRMAVEMMKGLLETKIITNVQPRRQHRVVSSAAVNASSENVSIFSLDGKLLSSAAARATMKPGNMYIVFNKATGASTKLMMMAPAVR